MTDVMHCSNSHPPRNGQPKSYQHSLGQHALSALQDPSCSDNVEEILAAMKRAPADTAVQVFGCERLWVLSWEDDTAVEIGRLHGVPILLEAMTRFPENVHLQLSAAETLQNLAAVSDTNRDEICSLGGVALLLQAMMRHLGCTSIQLSGCTALASLAKEGGNGSAVGNGTPQGFRNYTERRKCIKKAGGYHGIIITAHHHPNDLAILKVAYDALIALGREPAEIKEKLPQLYSAGQVVSMEEVNNFGQMTNE